MPTTWSDPTVTWSDPDINWSGEAVSVIEPPRYKVKPALPEVSWDIDGYAVTVGDWSANCVAPGGFDQARVTLPESQARRIPQTIRQGSVLTAYADGLVVWQGRLFAAPAIREGVAQLAAQGEKVRAEKEAHRLFYQTRDASLFQDSLEPPYLRTTSSQDMNVEASVGGLKFQSVEGTGAQTNEFHGMTLWTPGSLITRYAYRMLSNLTLGSHVIRPHRLTGPAGTRTALTDRSFTADTTVDATIATPEDALEFQYTYTGGAGTFGNSVAQLIDLRVNGIAPGDTYYGSEVLADVGGRLGWDTSGVASSSLNVLPLDWDGDWASLLSYISSLEDRYWRVCEDMGNGPMLSYETWGTKEWVVYQGDGAQVELTPLELYNKAVVKYEDVAGPREYPLTADPDPLAFAGISNVIEHDLADVQPDSTLAESVAQTLVTRYAEQRYSGSISAVKVFGPSGPASPYEVRAGDTVRVADWGPAEDITVRVSEVEYRPDGITIGVEAPVDVSSLIAQRGLVSARARQTPTPMPVYKKRKKKRRKRRR